MKKANPGQSWLATWKKGQDFHVYHADDESFNPWGFGAFRLNLTKIPMRHPSTASDILLHVAGIELRNYGVNELIESLPEFEDVEEAAHFEATHLKLEWLRGERKLAFNKIAQTHDFAEQIILRSDELPYGTLFVPKTQSDLLDTVPYTGQLSLTHDLVDTVSTKHRLMAQLGFNDAINKDLRRIDNALDYAERKAR